jgi:hypothetical protein
MFYINTVDRLAYTISRDDENEIEIDTDISNMSLYGICEDGQVYNILDTTHGVLLKLTKIA